MNCVPTGDGAIILAAVTVFLWVWIAWLLAQIVGEALLPYMSRIVAWAARRVSACKRHR